MSKAVLLIDGNNLMAINTHAHLSLTAPDGTPTGGMFGVVKKLRMLLLEELGDYDIERVIFVKDHSRPAFRTQLCPTYKTGREKAREKQDKGKGREGEEIEFHAAYKQQMKLVNELLRPLGIRCLSFKGWEADDVLAYLTLYRYKEQPVVICSGDKDLLQLVNKRVHVYQPHQRQLVDKVPKGYLLRRCMEGDSSDNIPGIGQMGLKRAQDVIDFMRKHGLKHTPKNLIKMVESYGAQFPHHSVLAGKSHEHMLPEKAEALRRNWKVMNLRYSSRLINESGFFAKANQEFASYTDGRAPSLNGTTFFNQCRRWNFKSILQEKNTFLQPFKGLRCDH